tara:strand:- start:91 stop:597 length:507 start_codon:yes stop_codon:yes gene_type:complete
MNTIKKSRYPRINKIFQKPKNFDIKVDTKDADFWCKIILDKISSYYWDNKKPTSLLLGRWQPFHEGHYKLFLQALKKTDQVIFYVKDVYKLGDNPFTFKKVKRLVNIKLEKMFKNRYKVQLAPNVTNVLYGRKVGYQIKKINLEKRIQNISGTKIRKLMRKKGILNKI